MDPSLCAAMRFDLAALALFPQTIGHWDLINSPKQRQFFFSCVVIGLTILFGYIGQGLGLTTSSAEKAAFICSLNVVFVALLSSLKVKQFQLQTWVATLLAVSGVALLELRGPVAPNIGDFLLFFQPIGFGLGYFLLGELMTSNKDITSTNDISNPQDPKIIDNPKIIENNVKEEIIENSAGAATGFSVLTVATGCTLWATVVNHHTISDISPLLHTPFAIGALIYLSFFSTAAMEYIQTRALQEVPAADAVIIISSEPIWASLFAAGN